MEELRNPNTNMIGVYGIGDVGKTTLRIIDVKQNPDLERIQKKIAEKLKDTEILVILDDVWDRIDLLAWDFPVLYAKHC
ncbi:unnamed protein product [Prunus armeniaca]|uniref:NB-ARC domain-containing protein n=1 Tax=Prunus armeniaca TaxID=36596 RepID=A0A6J5UQ24_PRUAR|nr:unnamed protein product [Prunus armeniaca]